MARFQGASAAVRRGVGALAARGAGWCGSLFDRFRSWTETQPQEMQALTNQTCVPEVVERNIVPDPAEPFGSPKRAVSDWDLVQLLPINVNKRVFVNGFPGAGNVIVQQLFLEILAAAGAKAENIGVRGGTGSLHLMDYVGPRHDGLMALFRRALPDDWNGDVFPSHRNNGSVDFAAVNDDAFIIAKEIDLGVHLNGLVHSTHELPSLKAYQNYADAGFEVVPVVRHPLDLMVSFAAKGFLSASGKNLLAEFDRRASEAQRKLVSRHYRRMAVRQRFSDERWVLGVGEALRRYYKIIGDMADTYQPTRFEDCLGSPLAFVSMLQDRIGFSVPQSKVEQIAALIGTAEFVRGHLNDPSIGKWRSQVKFEEIRPLRDIGLFDVFEKFGYASPAEQDFAFDSGGEDSLEVLVAHGFPASIGAVSDPIIFMQFLAHAFIFDPLDEARRLGLQDIVHSVPHGRLTLVGNDSNLLKRFSMGLTREVLVAINRA